MELGEDLYYVVLSGLLTGILTECGTRTSYELSSNTLKFTSMTIIIDIQMIPSLMRELAR